jgi:hypothetical protein
LARVFGSPRGIWIADHLPHVRRRKRRNDASCGSRALESPSSGDRHGFLRFIWLCFPGVPIFSTGAWVWRV